jgi:hypothetical protein
MSATYHTVIARRDLGFGATGGFTDPRILEVVRNLSP